MILKQRTSQADRTEIAQLEASLQAMKFDDRLRRHDYGLFFRDLPDGTRLLLVAVPDEAALAGLGGDWSEPSGWGERGWGELSWSVVMAEQETLANLGLNNSPEVRHL